MAETFNEDDELNRVVEWLKTNGPALIAGVVLGLIIIGGWKWWTVHVDRRAQAAATLYGSVSQQIASGDVTDQVKANVDRLKQDYGDSPYAANAVLGLAAHAVAEKDYDRAGKLLDWVINNSASVPTKNLARLRKARVLWANDQSDAALKLLETDHPDSFDRVYAELSGDIHAALGQRADAHAAYEKAAAAATEGMGGALQRKLAQTSESDASADTKSDSVASAKASEDSNEGA